MMTRIKTLDMQRKDWLQKRKMGIGGSDAGAICGLNPYVSPMQVYLEKISDEIEDKDNESMRQGRDFEDYVAKRFMEETGKKVRKSNIMYVNQAHPFMFANVDRLVVGEDAGLECKTASAYSADKWKDGNVPEHYYIQCCHYMAVTNAKAWYLAVVILGKEFKFVKIERDEQMIQNLIQIEADFWKEHVQRHIMPDPDGTSASEEIIKKYFPNAREKKEIALLGFDEKLNRDGELSSLVERLEKEKKQIEQEVKVYMEDAQFAESDRFVVSWKNVFSNKFDANRLKEEKPDLYGQYLKQQKSRRFMIKQALPSVLTPERFTRMALSAINNTPKLAECSKMSFLAVLMNATQLGLEPNTPLGQAYLIPFLNKGKLE